MRTISTLRDPRFLGWAAIWSLISLLAYGLVSAIVPNPVFGRGIPPQPFAIAVWLASAPLMGLVAATYLGPWRLARPVLADERSTGTLGVLGSSAAFVAIGCPTCNKIALILLGSSGAATVFGPIQPFIGAASLVLLGATVAWRLRVLAQGGACRMPAEAVDRISGA